MGKESACNAGDTGRRGFDPSIRKMPWKRSILEATHSCILAWRMPWTEEPGGLDMTEATAHTHTHTHTLVI